MGSRGSTTIRLLQEPGRRGRGDDLSGRRRRAPPHSRRSRSRSRTRFASWPPVRREPDEPAVRRLAGHLRGPGLARDSPRVIAQTAAGAAQHHVAHVAAEQPRGSGVRNGVVRRFGGRRLSSHARRAARRRRDRPPRRAPSAAASRRTSPWPYPTCGSVASTRARRRAPASARCRAGRGVEQRLRPQPDGQLREVRVARMHEAVVHVDPAVRMRVQHIVANRPAPAGDLRADAAVGQTAHMNACRRVDVARAAPPRPSPA